ncbi:MULTISPECIES: CHRD domain-containing protein [Nguyenibacter]|uniref:CHRD domain-containing protein n=1 Tax=Nguyenibacter vanlangensis TaxID=1216886 RepID=A0ABZ3D4I5_9PROT|nr:CHRD domain-containing protein [Nguyenibacter sp. L1]WRH87425.1 CHRD domain-containing protein [Nguyenibacter sp. L1]
MIRSFLIAGMVLAVPALAAAPVQARTVPVTGPFVPAAGASPAVTGRFTGTLDEKRNLVTYTIKYSGLSGPVMAAHFHGPADPGQDAGVMVPIKGPYASPLHGAVVMTPEQVTALRAGRVYVNLHTEAHPNGEARAQLQVRGAQ